jgi:uncharacterized membrane protein
MSASGPAALYRWYEAPICNRKPERAPRIGRYCFPLCWRCTAAATAIIVGRFAFPDVISPWVAWPALLLLLPAYIDGVAQYEYRVESNNVRRVWTGLLLGVGLVTFWRWAKWLF